MPRLQRVEPLEYESISHYLGRLRRARGNSLASAYALGAAAGIGAVTSRWEKLYFNPFPSHSELLAIAELIGLDLVPLEATLPPKGIVIQPRPIRLCAACYSESPCHRIVWQAKSELPLCTHHGLRLLEKCPCCKSPFKIPANWDIGQCHHCKMPFSAMSKKQKKAPKNLCLQAH